MSHPLAGAKEERETPFLKVSVPDMFSVVVGNFMQFQSAHCNPENSKENLLLLKFQS